MATFSNYFFLIPEQFETGDILSLNDDCLAIIFEYLDLTSQLRFSSCHARLEVIFTTLICPRLIPQEFIINELQLKILSDWELRQFYKTAGQFIKGIKYKMHWDCHNLRKHILLMQEFCTNIQRVQVLDTMPCEILEIFILLNINILTEIELYNCSLLDTDLEVLVKCRNLNSLGLARNPDLVGDFLPNFDKLQRLSLYHCNIKMDNLMETCKNSNFKYLDITTYLPISNSEVLKHCRDLETLKMSVTCDKDLENILILENLKSLRLNFLYKASPLSVTALLNKLNNLEALKLFKFNNNILPNSFGTFSALRTLWISMMHKDSINLGILQCFSTFIELEEIYLSKTCISKYNDLLPVVTNCLKLKRIYMYESKVSDLDEIMHFINSCSEILESRGHNTNLTIFFTGILKSKLSLIKDLTAPFINKMLILKAYSVFLKEGLLNNDLPVTELSQFDSDSDDEY